MSITPRPYTGIPDQPAMAALAHARPGDNVHVIDIPYRFSSWALNDPEHVGLWYDDEDRLIGWAILQTPFWAIDMAVHPNAERALFPRIVRWADQRAQAVRHDPHGRPMWFIHLFAHQHARIRTVEQVGFSCQAQVPVDPWRKVWLVRSATEALPEVGVRPDCTIRPLAGASEADAYVETHRTVFESKNMTREWRLRTIQRPEYRPESDLVAVARDGRLAGFCVGWFDPSGPDGCPAGQIEPLGVHPEFQHQGLGRALLVECIRRLHRLGATRVYVETDNYRASALNVYASAGFHTDAEILVYRKDYGSSQA